MECTGIEYKNRITLFAHRKPYNKNQRPHSTNKEEEKTM